MKIWYLTCRNTYEYAVVYAETKEKAFEKLVSCRPIGVNESDINMWTIEEFKENSYDGVLYFY